MLASAPASGGDDGQLHARVKEALELCPAPDTARALTARIQTTLAARGASE